MKSAVIALFLGATSAIKMQDADPYFNEPTWTERMPSAGGFVQITACVNANASGVTCSPPNQQLFSTGMNGDEDLGQDIIMKGKPFHYNQQPQALFATGMNGDEDLGQDIIMKGKPFHYNQAPANSKLFATGMNGDEDLGQDIIMKGKPFHYNQN